MWRLRSMKASAAAVAGGAANEMCTNVHDIEFSGQFQPVSLRIVSERPTTTYAAEWGDDRRCQMNASEANELPVYRLQHWQDAGRVWRLEPSVSRDRIRSMMKNSLRGEGSGFKPVDLLDAGSRCGGGRCAVAGGV
jgi:hypothetical protein